MFMSIQEGKNAIGLLICPLESDFGRAALLAGEVDVPLHIFYLESGLPD